MNVTPRMAGLLKDLLDEFLEANTVTTVANNDVPPATRAKALRRAPVRAVVPPDPTIEVDDISRARARRGLMRAGFIPKGP